MGSGRSTATPESTLREEVSGALRLTPSHHLPHVSLVVGVGGGHLERPGSGGGLPGLDQREETGEESPDEHCLKGDGTALVMVGTYMVGFFSLNSADGDEMLLGEADLLLRAEGVHLLLRAEGVHLLLRAEGVHLLLRGFTSNYTI